MKKHFYLFKAGLCALAVGLLAGCSEEVDGPQMSDSRGVIRLNVSTDAGFQTKASDGKAYEDLNNYTVQILQNNSVVENHEYAYPEMPQFIELANGTYSFKAFYGEDKAVYSGADTTNLYFSDEKSFTLAGDTATISLNCEPNSARLNIVFAETMDTYFSDYRVEISTVAQGVSLYPWTKTTQGPVYFKVGDKEEVKLTVTLTTKDGKAATPVTSTSVLSPRDAKTITVEPVSNTGSVGITIKVDETVVEHEVVIDVPSDWV